MRTKPLDMIHWYNSGFFVSGHIKNVVYNRKPQTLKFLKNFIEEKAVSITAEICQNTIQSFHEKLQICIDNGASSVEKY